ncbi:hypothetical protein P170DRAFT_250961 [Aspergillus steynii IBT 23096]|uniref:Uncharacterized protein n=1 Tax=Aspergillus steynii IBT 23096 TaxID=1392250 RepID=A0A2I2FYM4_9EURO|nr:uncharacterized protein P170DRAFT_250961 [Aspergillus steynii IBT 23096]PLB45732.1 hypothetical protein P170DRAFT_250961 [Aspergillus steynii IBT 23096]
MIQGLEGLILVEQFLIHASSSDCALFLFPHWFSLVVCVHSSASSRKRFAFLQFANHFLIPWFSSKIPGLAVTASALFIWH